MPGYSSQGADDQGWDVGEPNEAVRLDHRARR
jgi:hypothetical protein